MIITLPSSLNVRQAKIITLWNEVIFFLFSAFFNVFDKTKNSGILFF